MNWEAIGTIAEIVVTAGVIVSLIFVVFQMRQNTLALKTQIHENITAGYISSASMMLPYAKELLKRCVFC